MEHTSLAIFESNPEVGSSRKTTRGWEMSAKATFTRFACPPEIPLRSTFPITVLRHLSKRSWLMTASTRLRLSALVTDRGSFISAVYMSI
mmetsp:Transcript_27627/g.51829  ORF Transcript_27627/g.51829 Transcript_27627/m.51829 type:complete len:90 (+) Transcript_27627:1556-1825(+)